jgi:hypothetical protein
MIDGMPSKPFSAATLMPGEMTRGMPDRDAARKLRREA